MRPSPRQYPTAKSSKSLGYVENFLGVFNLARVIQGAAFGIPHIRGQLAKTGLAGYTGIVAGVLKTMGVYVGHLGVAIDAVRVATAKV